MVKKNLSSKYNLAGTSETQKNGYQLGDEKNVKTLKIEAKYASRKSYGIPLEKWLQQYAFSFVERNYYIRRAIGSSKNCLRPTSFAVADSKSRQRKRTQSTCRWST